LIWWKSLFLTDYFNCLPPSPLAGERGLIPVSYIDLGRGWMHDVVVVVLLDTYLRFCVESAFAEIAVS